MMKTKVKIDLIWLASRDVRGGQKYHSWRASRNKYARRPEEPFGSTMQLSRAAVVNNNIDSTRANERIMLKCDDDQWSSEQLCRSINSVILCRSTNGNDERRFIFGGPKRMKVRSSLPVGSVLHIRNFSRPTHPFVFGGPERMKVRSSLKLERVQEVQNIRVPTITFLAGRREWKSHIGCM